MASVSGLGPARRIHARDRAVQAATLAYNHKDQVHYTQGGARWSGISNKLDASKGQYPKYADCSAFATWCIWNGLYLPYKARDTVNGAGWRAGYTGTMLSNGKQVHHLYNVQRADCVIYGHGSPGEHTAIIVGRRKSDNKPMVISHGSEAGPFYLPYDYRSDIMQIRRYI